MSAQGHLLEEQQQHLGELDVQIDQLANAASQALSTCSPRFPSLMSSVDRAQKARDFYYSSPCVSPVRWCHRPTTKITLSQNLLSSKALTGSAVVWEIGDDPTSPLD